MGGVVLVVAGIFVYFFANTAQVQAVQGYEVKAIFLKIGGLQTGSDVRVSGINIGTVTGQRLDPETFDAIVTLTVKPNIKLPKDTVATIASAGMIGGKYIRIRPGQSKEMLKAGGTIDKTEDFKSLEEQVGEIIFLATDKGGESN